MAQAVLVLDGGSNPAVVSVRSLGRAGWRVLAQKGTRSSRSRYVAERVAMPHAHRDPDGFSDRVVEICNAEHVDAVLPCTDVELELLWACADELGGAAIVGADRASAERFIDKAGQLAAADVAGFPTPAWRAPATIDDVAPAAAELGFPCVVKPRRTYARVGSQYVQRRHITVTSTTEARAAADALSPDGQPPLVEEFVPGRALSVSGVVVDGELACGVAREAITFFPIAGGSSIWRRTIPPDDVGVQEAFELLRSLDYEGLAEVEYQAGPDGPRLMEIGLRAHGWFSLAVAAGVDLPLLGARAALGEKLPATREPRWQVGVEMRSLGGEADRIRAALDLRQPMPHPYTRLSVLAKAWPPWRPGMRYDYISLDDPNTWLPRRLRRGRS